MNKLLLSVLTAIVIGSMSMSSMAGPSHYTQAELAQWQKNELQNNLNPHL